MMASRQEAQPALFYEFSLEEHVPRIICFGPLIGYCFGIRSERRLFEEVHPNLAYRWFCRLEPSDRIPDHSILSRNRHGRFRDSALLRLLFEGTLARCIEEGLVSGQRMGVERASPSGGQGSR